MPFIDVAVFTEGKIKTDLIDANLIEQLLITNQYGPETLGLQGR